jgi:hypothetical protein
MRIGKTLMGPRTEDDVPDSEEATGSMSTRTFKRFKGAAGNTISSILVNIRNGRVEGAFSE